jgi:hypothetical protein
MIGRRTRLDRVVALAAWMLFAALPTSAQTVAKAADGTVSIKADAVPLETLLQSISAVSPFQRLVVAEESRDRLITVSLENVPLREALIEMLSGADIGFVLLGSDRLAVGGRVGTPATSPSPDTRSANALTPPARMADNAPAMTAEEKAAADERFQELERALTMPPVPGPRRGGVMLPFPGPDGAPIVSPYIDPAASVEPMTGAPAARPGGAPAPSPAPVDPALQQLLDSLRLSIVK